jgi:chitodextrinase
VRSLRFALPALLMLTAGSLAQPPTAFAPGKPKDLEVTARGTDSVDLDWRKVRGSEGYYVYRDGNRVAEVDQSDYRDTGLQPATTYVYRVSAFDDDGDEGDLSDALQVTTEALPGPTVPTDLVATAVGPYRIDLDWSPSEAASGVSFYRVFRDGAEIGTTDKTSYSDASLEPETEYEYRVSAVDGLGNESDRSDRSSATTEVEPGPTVPTDLVATAVSPYRIDLDWSPSEAASGVSFYRVFRDGDEVATTDKASYSDSSLEPETEYEYRVSAVDGLGNESDRSDRSTATTEAEPGPPAPRDVTAIAWSSTQVNLSWNPPPASAHPVQGYNVYREGESIGFVVSTAFIDTGLTPETTYGYTVAGVDTRGVEGERSDVVSATTDAPSDVIPPARPTGLRLVGN